MAMMAFYLLNQIADLNTLTIDGKNIIKERKIYHEIFVEIRMSASTIPTLLELQKRHSEIPIEVLKAILETRKMLIPLSTSNDSSPRYSLGGYPLKLMVHEWPFSEPHNNAWIFQLDHVITTDCMNGLEGKYAPQIRAIDHIHYDAELYKHVIKRCEELRTRHPHYFQTTMRYPYYRIMENIYQKGFMPSDSTEREKFFKTYNLLVGIPDDDNKKSTRRR